ncbi:serine hydrolase domain-containing protein [Commensalibacter communis]|uniref:serine hydrolase domain-containing protein n=1 Tax=Commensalibacter communis TaxID=2972786 RepID=UPI0022FF9BF6|nr:serine hydrolase [Commensalibacter communis]CAI3951591.1 CubicO group peptidase [Commensalibacter communis]CAI3953947.1 CubicO group peptidase [Commensalibacter communis]
MKKILSVSLLSMTMLVSLQNLAHANTTQSGETRQSVKANAGNGFYYPANRWSYQHMQQLYPSANVDSQHYSNGLPKKLQNLDDLMVKDGRGKQVKLTQYLEETYTDSFVVVKDGQIIYEKYLNGQDERTRHQMMSVTKSISSTAIQPLIDEGKIDPNAKVTKYVPELAGSAWADATVQQVRDMLVSLDYTENYDDPKSGFNNYLRAMGFTAPDTEFKNTIGIHKFLQGIKKGKGEHGTIFNYATPNTDVLCWIAQKASGKNAETLIDQNLWSKLSTIRDAYLLVDRQGQAFCGAGSNATAVDLAKFGMIMANDGKLGNQQIVSKKYVDEVIKGGSKEAFDNSHYAHFESTKGWTYKDQWWIRNNPNHAFAAVGIYDQIVYVDPTAKVVVVKQSSRKVAEKDDDDTAVYTVIDTIISKLDHK